MNPILVRNAVDNIRKVVEQRGRYRRLMPSDIVEVEAYLQQILVEANTVTRRTWLNRLLNKGV